MSADWTLAYNRYRSAEERIFIGTFWVSLLLLVVWLEICLGWAVWRLLART